MDARPSGAAAATAATVDHRGDRVVHDDAEASSSRSRPRSPTCASATRGRTVRCRPSTCWPTTTSRTSTGPSAATWPGVPWRPIEPVSDATPALYLGFDRDAAGRRARPVRRRRRGARRDEPARARVGVLGRRRLAAAHGGRRDARPARAGHRRSHRAGGHGRARALRRAALLAARPAERGRRRPATPALRALLPNATWVTQRQTVVDEPLGAGSGEPGQVLTFRQVPVLPGQRHRGRASSRAGAPTSSGGSSPRRCFGGSRRRDRRARGRARRRGRRHRVPARAAAARARPLQARHRSVGALGGAADARSLGPGRPPLRARPRARPAALRRRACRRSAPPWPRGCTAPAAAAPATSPARRDHAAPGPGRRSRARVFNPAAAEGGADTETADQRARARPAQRAGARPRGDRRRPRDACARGVAVGGRRARASRPRRRRPPRARVGDARHHAAQRRAAAVPDVRPARGGAHATSPRARRPTCPADRIVVTGPDYQPVDVIGDDRPRRPGRGRRGRARRSSGRRDVPAPAARRP